MEEASAENTRIETAEEILLIHDRLPVHPEPGQSDWYVIPGQLFSELRGAVKIQKEKQLEHLPATLKIKNAQLLKTKDTVAPFHSPAPSSSDTDLESVPESSAEPPRSVDCLAPLADGAVLGDHFELIPQSLWQRLISPPPSGLGLRYDVEILRNTFVDPDSKMLRVEVNPLTVTLCIAARHPSLSTVREPLTLIMPVQSPLAPESYKANLFDTSMREVSSTFATPRRTRSRAITMKAQSGLECKAEVRVSRCKSLSQILSNLNISGFTPENSVFYSRDQTTPDSDSPWTEVSLKSAETVEMPREKLMQDLTAVELGIDDATELLIMNTTTHLNIITTTEIKYSHHQKDQSIVPSPGPSGGMPVTGPSGLYLLSVPVPEKLKSRGLRGLQNLGNTCFMNSALQCLSHTMPLVVPFLKRDYEQDLNKENPLGTKCKLVNAYAAFLEQLWAPIFGDRNLMSPADRIVVPRALKKVVGEFAPNFSGYEQQDSQEFISFFLDGIHEDINRVRLKPVVETVEDNGQADDRVLAGESWQRHKMRNDSIIVDLFHGQYRSILQCPICKLESKVFDPFMYLSLPIPQFRSFVCRVDFFSSPNMIPIANEFGLSISHGFDFEIEITFRLEALEQELIKEHSAKSDSAPSWHYSRSNSISSIFSKTSASLSWPLSRIIKAERKQIELKIWRVILSFITSQPPSPVTSPRQAALYELLRTYNDSILVRVAEQIVRSYQDGSDQLQRSAVQSVVGSGLTRDSRRGSQITRALSSDNKFESPVAQRIRVQTDSSSKNKMISPETLSEHDEIVMHHKDNIVENNRTFSFSNLTTLQIYSALQKLSGSQIKGSEQNTKSIFSSGPNTSPSIRSALGDLVLFPITSCSSLGDIEQAVQTLSAEDSGGNESLLVVGDEKFVHLAAMLSFRNPKKPRSPSPVILVSSLISESENKCHLKPYLISLRYPLPHQAPLSLVTSTLAMNYLGAMCRKLGLEPPESMTVEELTDLCGNANMDVVAFPFSTSRKQAADSKADEQSASSTRGEIQPPMALDDDEVNEMTSSSSSGIEVVVPKPSSNIFRNDDPDSRVDRFSRDRQNKCDAFVFNVIRVMSEFPVLRIANQSVLSEYPLQSVPCKTLNDALNGLSEDRIVEECENEEFRMPYLMVSLFNKQDQLSLATKFLLNTLETVPVPEYGEQTSLQKSILEKLEFDFIEESLCHISAPLKTQPPQQPQFTSPFVSRQSVSRYSSYLDSGKRGMEARLLATLNNESRVSIYDSLQEFVSIEQLGGANQWYCPKCKVHCDALKKIDLWRLPEILVICFNRFSQISRSRIKLETAVSFPFKKDEPLDLQPFVLPSAEPEQYVSQYQLFAVSDHVGSLGGGHYTARVCCEGPTELTSAFSHPYKIDVDDESTRSAEWYNFNDTSASPLSEHDLTAEVFCSESAYVLFYRRINVMKDD